MSVAACFESVLIVEIHQVASVLGARAASSPVQFIGVIRESDEISDTVVVADDTSSITVNISVADRFAAPTGTLVRVCGHVGFTSGSASVAARVIAAIPDLDFAAHKTILLKRRAFLARQGLLSESSFGSIVARLGVGSAPALAEALSHESKAGSRGRGRIRQLYGALSADGEDGELIESTASGADEDRIEAEPGHGAADEGVATEAAAGVASPDEAAAGTSSAGSAPTQDVEPA